ncbi:hypothetical protein [Streptomyces althioticus]|uniref:hypothetical protein n=1 Tax=Streptomyces althioticus TaxID=83380 RepID=UPI00369CF942
MTAKILPQSIAQAIACEASQPGATPLVRAKLARILTDAGYEGCEVADLFRTSAGRVLTLLACLGLTPEGQRMLDSGALPERLGEAVAQLSPENQGVMLARWARGEFASPDHATRYARIVQRDEQMAF